MLAWLRNTPREQDDLACRKLAVGSLGAVAILSVVALVGTMGCIGTDPSVTLLDDVLSSDSTLAVASRHETNADAPTGDGGTTNDTTADPGPSTDTAKPLASGAADVPKILTGLSIRGPNTVSEGGTGNYTATATYDDSSTAELTGNVDWSVSSGPDSINSSGVYSAPPVVTADTLATIHVSYSEGGVTVETDKNITISNVTKILTGISISGPNTVSEGGTGNYTATATYDDGGTAEVTDSADWSVSSGPGSINSSGVYSAPATVTADTLATIHVSYSEGGVTVETDKNITISNVTKILTGVSISGPNVVLEGNSGAYNATATYDDGSTADVTANSNWHVGNGPGSVNSTGIYTAPESASALTSATINVSYTEASTERLGEKAIAIIGLEVSPISLTWDASASDDKSIWLASTGTLALQFEITDVPHWLTVSPLSGDASENGTEITVHINDYQGLSPGAHQAVMKITPKLGSSIGMVKNVTVTVLIAELSSSPENIRFGPSTIPVKLEVWNSGGGTLQYDVSTDADWLNLTSTRGESTGEHDTIAATVDRTGLEPGDYVATITVSSPQPGVADKTISVTLTMVSQPPTADAGPDQTVTGGDTVILNISGNAGSDVDAVQRVFVAPDDCTNPWNADDATACLQEAVVAQDGGQPYDKILVRKQAGPWVVQPIFLESNTTIEFEEGVVVEAKANTWERTYFNTHDHLFKATLKTNIILKGYNATFRMREDEGHSIICFQRCSNVTVEGLTLKNARREGVIVKGYAGVDQPYCDNVTIRNVNIEGTHRNGIWVESANALTIEGCTITNTTGNPGFGIDFEPMYDSRRLTGIVVKRCVFKDNQMGAIVVSPYMLAPGSAELDILVEDCYVESPGGSGLVPYRMYDQGVGGVVEFRRVVIENTKYPIRLVDKSKYAATVIFANCVVKQPTGVTPIQIAIELHLKDKTVDFPGGIVFNNCQVFDDVDRHTIVTYGPAEDDKLYDLTGDIYVANENRSGSLYNWENWAPSRLDNVMMTFHRDTVAFPAIVLYRWRQISGPSVVLKGADTSAPAFTAPPVAVETDLVFELYVEDNIGSGSIDTVTVTVVPAG